MSINPQICATCRLHGKTEVPYAGNLGAEVVFVGESPGQTEETQGGPFLGRAGQLLRRKQVEVGIDPSQVFFANAARCRIDKDELTTRALKDVLSCCRPNLKAILEHIKPKLIVCLGAIALEQVTGMTGIGKVRGTFWYSSEFDCQVSCTWHPAYILRNQNKEPEFAKDLQTISEFTKNDFQPPDQSLVSVREIDTLRPILDQTNIRIGMDSETQGLYWWDPNSIVITFQVSLSDTEGGILYLHEECERTEADFEITCERSGLPVTIGIRRVPDYDRKIEELRELCARPDIQKVMMNGNFELHRLQTLGITDVQGYVMDVQAAAHVLDSELHLSASLGDLQKAFGTIKVDYKDVYTDTEKADMLMQIRRDRNKFNWYAGLDPVITLDVSKGVKAKLLQDPPSLNYYIHFMHPVTSKVLYEMELNGIKVDMEALPQAVQDCEAEMEHTEDWFRSLLPVATEQKHGTKFKMTRKAILMDALYCYRRDKDNELVDVGFHLRPPKLTDSGKPSCDKGALSVLLGQDIPAEAKDMIRAYTSWSEFNTLRTRYLKNLEIYVAPDGRVHSSFSFTTTTSGRSSSRDPNNHNIPKRSARAQIVRRLYVAPEGRVFLEADFSQSELRWVADVADVARMKEVYIKDLDLHTITAMGMAHKEAADITSAERQAAKPVNFGIVYKISPQGLKQYAAESYGVEMSIEEATEYIRSFFSLYPEVRYWHDDCRRVLLEQGYLRTKFGRKRICRDIFSDARGVQAQAERAAINAVIQGPSSDMAYLAALQIINDPEYNRDEAKVLLCVHDNLVFEVDENCLEKYARLLKQHMEHVDTRKFNFELSIPMKIEAAFGPNMYDMQPYEF